MRVTLPRLLPPRVKPRHAPAMRALGHLLLQTGSILVLLAAWLIAGQFALVRPFLLPPLPDVAMHIIRDVATGAFFTDAGLTLYRTAIGFALACALGIPIGILIAFNRGLRWFADPLISVGFPMPKIAFLPIFMLWFGVYDLSKIVMIAFASIFTITAAAEAGTRGVDKYLIWSARFMGTSKLAIFHEVILPASLPQLMTGLQVALPIALITTVATEMLMGGAGLGGAMMAAGSYADSTGIYAGIVETSLVGAVAVAAMAQLRKWLLRWSAEFNPR